MLDGDGLNPGAKLGRQCFGGRAVSGFGRLVLFGGKPSIQFTSWS